MTNTGKKFLFVGSAAYSNRGCEAIVRGTVEILSAKMPGSRYIISSSFDDFPNDGFESNFNIEYRKPYSNKWNSAARVLDPKWWYYRILLRSKPELTYRHKYQIQLKAMRECDFALQVGGDNYTLDYGVPDYLMHLDNELLSYGKPLILWGASIGPFSDTPIVEARIAKHLKRFTLILAREPRTIKYLASLGVEKNVRRVADPAFCMSPMEPILDDELSTFISKKPIGINISGFAGKFTRHHDEGSWLENSVACIRKLLEEGFRPLLLVPHVFKDINDDHKFLGKIIERLPQWQSQLAIVPKTLNAAELKWVIAKTRLFAGARMHSTIAALSSCVPTLSLGYSMKSKGVNEDIFGNQNWLLPVEQLNPESLSAKMNELKQSETFIETHLKANIPIVQEKSRLGADFVLESLKLT